MCLYLIWCRDTKKKHGSSLWYDAKEGADHAVRTVRRQPGVSAHNICSH